MTDPLSFWIPALPRVVLSTNGTRREKRNPWSVSDAKGELHALALKAASECGRSEPFEGLVDVVVVLHVMRDARKVECPRCLERAIGEPSKFNGTCLCYRPLDPSNIGGEVIKPVIDGGLVGSGLITDDRSEYVRWVMLGLVRVQTVEQEGYEVTVRPVAEEAAA